MKGRVVEVVKKSGRVVQNKVMNIVRVYSQEGCKESQKVEWRIL